MKHFQCMDDQHPQDLIVDQIIDKIMTNKYGPDWDVECKHQEQASKFEQNKKNFYMQLPKFKINFHNYQNELSTCIQSGVAPLFPYPMQIYSNRSSSSLNQSKDKKDCKFVQLEKRSEEELHELKLTEMKEYIQRKQKYKMND